MKVRLDDEFIRFDDVFFGMDEGVAYSLFISNSVEDRYRIIVKASGGGYFTYLNEQKQVYKDGWVSCRELKGDLRQLITAGWKLEAFDHPIELFQRVTKWWENQIAIQEEEENEN